MSKSKTKDGRTFHQVNLEERRTGKSTALALKYLSEAIQNPGTMVTIKDHLSESLNDKYLGDLIKDISDRLGLQDVQVGVVEYPSKKRAYYVQSDWLGIFCGDDSHTYKRID